jgi:hypothetical protein
MEVRIQEPDSKQSAAGLRGVKLPGPAACLGDPATNKMMELVQITEDRHDLDKQPVQPLVVSGRKNSRPYSAEISTHATL